MLPPDVKEQFLQDFPHYRFRYDADYGRKVETTDEEIERAYEIEDVILWESLELEHPILAAWIEHVNGQNEDLGEIRRYRLADIVRMSFSLGLIARDAKGKR